MDPYEVLGVSRNASKEEIKVAFRKKAMEFHPDKHAQSPKYVKDGATRRFKQISEAYEFLIDDPNRAHFNLRSNSNGARTSGYGYGHDFHSYRSNYGRSSGYGSGFVSNLHIALQFLTTRTFLLNLALAGVLVGAMGFIDTSREAIWKMRNRGKSFEDTMESIQKAKADRDET